MILTRLTINLKKRLDVELGRWTFVYGPNWSGKTALRQAVHLLVEGRVPGRDLGSVPVHLLQLVPADETRLVVTASARDPVGGADYLLGVQISRRGRGGSKPTVPEGCDGRLLPNFRPGEPCGVLLGGDVRAAFDAGEDARKSAILSLLNFPGDLDSLLRERVGKPYRSWLAEFLRSVREADSGERGFAAEVQVTKKRIEADLRVARRCEVETIERAREAAQAAWTEEDEAALAALDEVAREGDPHEAWRSRVETARLRLGDLERELAAGAAAVPSREDLDWAAEVGALVAPALKMLALDGRQACFACGAERSDARWAERRQVLQRAGAVVAKIEELRGRVEHVARLEREAAARRRAASEPEPQELDLTETLAKADALRGKRALSLRAADAKREAIGARQRVLALEAVQAALEGVRTDVLEAEAERFAREVSAYMPGGKRVNIDPYEGRVGLDGAGGWAVLSGGEQAFLVGALGRRRAQAHLEKPFRILELDELSMTPAVVLDLLRALSRGASEEAADPVTQTLVFFPSDDLVRVPEGWTSVRL